MSQATADVLTAAADLLERDGWCQGLYFRRGAHCALGAIHAVSRDGDADSAAVWALSRALDDAHPAQWNDHPDRTKEEVVAKLREVAAQEAKS